MKKILTFFCTAVILFLVGCSGKNTSVTEKKTTAEPVTKANVTTAGSYDTFTGYKPLKKINYVASDSENKRGLSTKEIDHSFGVAKNSKPHEISVENQKYFDEKNFNAVAYDNKTKEKVLYLTFDCGWENGYTGRILDVLKKENVPAAFFCTLAQIKSQPELTARMIKEGHIVGNHSANHPNFSRISRQEMANEIEECENYLRENFGYCSKLFRFPEGAYSDCALDLVASLGYKSVFWSVAYSDWDVNKRQGKEYAFKTVTQRLHPGAIILLHSVSADNADAMEDIIKWAKSQGYKFKSL